MYQCIICFSLRSSTDIALTMTFAIHLVVSGKKIASFGYLIFSVMLPFLILFSASVFATQRQMFCRHLTIATHRRQDAGAKHVVDATFATPVSSLSGGGCPQWVRRVRYPRVGFKRNRPIFFCFHHSPWKHVDVCLAEF